MGDATWYLKGLTSGPFAPNAEGSSSGSRQLGAARPHRRMAALGSTVFYFTVIRQIPHVPPRFDRK